MNASISAVQPSIAGRRIRVGVCAHTPTDAKIVAERSFEPGADIILAADGDAALVVPGWEGPPQLVIEGGSLLHVGPGMRVNMCGDNGEDHVIGTYEELSERGMTFPIHIEASRLNIKARKGISVFVHFVPDGSAHPMSAETESELNRLAEEGSRALTNQPATAAAKFEQAHDLALWLGQADTAASLSTLIARSWHLRSSLAQCIRFSRRAVREAPGKSGPHYTLGHFCENAAAQALGVSKKRRAIACFLAAQRAFDSAAALSDEPNQRASMKAAAERCLLQAQHLLGCS